MHPHNQWRIFCIRWKIISSKCFCSVSFAYGIFPCKTVPSGNMENTRFVCAYEFCICNKKHTRKILGSNRFIFMQTSFVIKVKKLCTQLQCLWHLRCVALLYCKTAMSYKRLATNTNAQSFTAQVTLPHKAIAYK